MTLVGVAIAGMGWMGHAHARAYARVRHHYPSLAAVLVSVADPEPERVAGVVAQYGLRGSFARWQDLLADPTVEALSITAPNFLHREIGVAAASAGKHIWIEKPVGLSAADAVAVADAVAAAGVQCTVGFNYRHAPAVAAARTLIDDGALGAVTHARFRLFADYAAHPRGALSWRFSREQGGNGVLGDLASHGVDLARYLLGDIASLVADTAVFIARRPLASGAGSHYALASGELADVENEDFLSSLLRLTSGARVTLEASRVSVGEQCNYGFEIHGSRGLLVWDFRRMGELGVSVGEAYQNQSVQTVFVGPGSGDYDAFQPAGGIAMSYDDLKVIEAARFLRSIAEGKPSSATSATSATIDDAVASARALEAMAESVRSARWVGVQQ